MDVRDTDSVERAIHDVQAQAGRLDVVVNNAGIGLAGAIEDTSVDEARALFETNFFGAHRVCRAALPHFRAQGSGLIVNVGSIGGRVTLPYQGFYSASKAALETLSASLRMECAAFGVRVVLVEPGDFATEFTEHRAFAAEAGQGSVYRARCERAVARAARDERAGARPDEFAALLVRIVEGRERGARALCGNLAQRAVGRLAPWLPARWVDRGMLAYYG
jgi:NAD(P)-dependent dehydrogenase (short-subunit alcohol dehydrogenase family)